ncbi:hypothetical protein [Leuconostoc lactis]|nr:hypothetical protein [Leuconostoc lactis]
MKREEVTFEISNLDEYKKLLNTAEEQFKQLKNTIQLIDTFEFKIQVDS